MNAWPSDAWTVVMDDGSERVVYADDKAGAIAAGQRLLRRCESEAEVVDAHPYEDGD